MTRQYEGKTGRAEVTSVRLLLVRDSANSSGNESLLGCSNTQHSIEIYCISLAEKGMASSLYRGQRARRLRLGFRVCSRSAKMARIRPAIVLSAELLLIFSPSFDEEIVSSEYHSGPNTHFSPSSLSLALPFVLLKITHRNRTEALSFPIHGLRVVNCSAL